MKPLIIDTHAHLYLKQFSKDQRETIQRAKKYLSHILLPNIDINSIEFMHQLMDNEPRYCFGMMGLHPCSVDRNFENSLSKMKELLVKRQSESLTDSAIHPYIGIGETGTDLFHDKTTIDLQCESLKIQIEWAKEFSLPIVLHCRESFEETIDLIEKAQDGTLKGLFHCFVGTVVDAERIIATGFKIGLGGVATYPKCDVADQLRKLHLDRIFNHIVLETDCPYLPPMPHRGHRNEPAYIHFTAQFLAKKWGISYDELVQITSENALHLFDRISFNTN